MIYPLQRFLLACLAAITLAACHSEPPLQHNSLFTFGTLVDVNLSHPDADKVQQAFTIVQQDFDYLHFAYHAWQPGPLGRINQLLETTSTFTANPSVLPLISEAQRLSLQSDGLFNPAIGHLINLWGFQSDEGIARDTPPGTSEIKALVAKKPGMQDLVINHTQLRSRNAAVKLDLGAVAKGYALDRVMQHLQELGISNAIINTGGDLKVIGHHPAGRPWHVGIRHPRQDNAIVAGLDVYDGESVFTSGDYERFFLHDGIRYHHIIDPRSGYPAMQAQSVTVIHHSATLADAASTALFIAGPQQWPQIARRMGIESVLFIDANGQAEATPAMMKRLQQINPGITIEVRSLP